MHVSFEQRSTSTDSSRRFKMYCLFLNVGVTMAQRSLISEGERTDGVCQGDSPPRKVDGDTRDLEIEVPSIGLCNGSFMEMFRINLANNFQRSWSFNKPVT
jgi:hypothetical protein